jgi:hypothetical protein
MGGAIAAAGFEAVGLLAQYPALVVGKKGAKGVFAGIAGLARHGESLAQQPLIIGALWHPQVLRQQWLGPMRKLDDGSQHRATTSRQALAIAPPHTVKAANSTKRG